MRRAAATASSVRRRADRLAVAVAAALLALASLLSAAAHAALQSSEPASGAAVVGPVTSIALDFTEGVEAAFSTFKLFRLDAAVDLEADNAELRLNGLAAVVISRHLGSQEFGEGQVEVELLADPADKSSVVLQTAEPLAPGHYVVMWRVLSADTHVVDGHFVFTVVVGE